jgi:pimeloyl-ACP methyl ester carboxylesterase
MRRLASRLSLAGYHTLRFDFFGTGDSSGNMTEADLSGWEADVESAIEGLKEIVGAAHVTLVGMRLGATIAAKVAARLAGEVEALVLWDPIVSGDEYLRSLQVIAPDAAARPLETSEPVAEIQGFPLTRRMMRDIQSIDLRSDLAAVPRRSLVLVTERLDSHDQLVSEDLPATRAKRFAIEFVDAPCPWLEAVSMTGTVPVAIIQRIAEWLA